MNSQLLVAVWRRQPPDPPAGAKNRRDPPCGPARRVTLATPRWDLRWALKSNMTCSWANSLV